MSQTPPPLRPGQSQPLGYASASQPELDLKRIATQQRAIMMCILAGIVLAVARFFAAANGMPAVAMAMGLVYLIVAIVGAVYIFMLSISLYNAAVGVILGILTLIPLIGLIVLLIVNNKATTTLRRHGIQVGLLGANPAAIQPGAIPRPPTAM